MKSIPIGGQECFRIIQGGLAVDFKTTCFFVIKISSLCVYVYIYMYIYIYIHIYLYYIYYQDYHEDNTNIIFKIAIQKKHTVCLFGTHFHPNTQPFNLWRRKEKKRGAFFTHQSKPPMKYLFIRLLSSDRDQTVSQFSGCGEFAEAFGTGRIFGTGVWESQNFLWCHCWRSFSFP